MRAETASAPEGEAMPDAEIKLRLKWRKTWEDTDDDFTSHDGGHEAGRIKLEFEGSSGAAWGWYCNGTIPGTNRMMSTGGKSATARAAAAALEACWFAAIDRINADLAAMPRRSLSPYALAKDPG